MTGSNQYTQRGNQQQPGQRRSGEAVAAACHPDQDAEDVAWVLNPDMDPWRDAGFDRDGWQDWSGFGWRPHQAAEWRDAGFESDQAQRWWDCGVRGPQTTLRWIQVGGFEDPEDTVEWSWSGPQQAAEWRDAGFDPGTAEHWQSEVPSLTAAEAARWVKIGVDDPFEVRDWTQEGFGPDDYRTARRHGLRWPHEAVERRDRDEWPPPYRTVE